MHLRLHSLALAASAVLPLLCPAQTASFNVSGAVKQPLTLTAQDLARLPRTEVKVDDHGKTAVYQGVLLFDILQKAGGPVGPELKGKVLASYVVATAKDGYEVVYAIAEMDPAFTLARIIVADTLDGKPLSDSVGPFRIVAPGDKKMARSVRMLQKLEVVRLAP